VLTSRNRQFLVVTICVIGLLKCALDLRHDGDELFKD
jgi:hypothetical protein